MFYVRINYIGKEDYMVKAIFFDLDGTLLPMDEKLFAKGYFYLLSKKMENYGYEQEKLISTVIKGTELMYRNQGNLTNENVFFSYFKDVYGEDKLKDRDYFDDFYLNEFYKTKEYCGSNILAKEIVSFCRDHFDKVVLSTNPIFPRQATRARMSFVGLSENDFDYVTTYENSSFCKPNQMYFLDLLSKLDLKAEEVILFGNNTYEDGECALKAGIKCYLTGDNVIYHKKSTHQFEYIKMEDIISFLKSII